MVEVLERGDVGFFYRPTVQPADAIEVTPGIQAFFMILSPSHGHFHRRVRIGRKRLPVRHGERLWSRVERVGSMQRVLADQLESETYTTKTRGARFQPGAVPVAQGCYAFVRHEDHTHFVYRVEHTEPVAELELPAAMSMIVLFERAQPANAVWTTGGLPTQLDFEGEELVLVGAHDEPELELGIEVLPVSCPA